MGETKLEKRKFEILARCSMQYFGAVVDDLRKKISPTQLEGVIRTPFGRFWFMPKVPSSVLRVSYLLDRYNCETNEFTFGNKIVPFHSSEFCIVMGLNLKGYRVNVDSKVTSKIANKYFKVNDKLVPVSRVRLVKIIKQLAGSTDSEEVDDFVRMFILLVFNCLLFPASNTNLSRGLVSFVDCLKKIGQFAWGDAAHKFLITGMKKHKKGMKFLDGCTMGLLAWFYEHVPKFGGSTSNVSFPRLFKWTQSKFPNNKEKAHQAMDCIAMKEILPIEVADKREEKLLNFPESIGHDDEMNEITMIHTEGLLEVLVGEEMREVDDEENDDNADDMNDAAAADDEFSGRKDGNDTRAEGDSYSSQKSKIKKKPKVVYTDGVEEMMNLENHRETAKEVSQDQAQKVYSRARDSFSKYSDDDFNAHRHIGKKNKIIMQDIPTPSKEAVGPAGDDVPLNISGFEVEPSTALILKALLSDLNAGNVEAEASWLNQQLERVHKVAKAKNKLVQLHKSKAKVDIAIEAAEEEKNLKLAELQKSQERYEAAERGLHDKKVEREILYNEIVKCEHEAHL